MTAGPRAEPLLKAALATLNQLVACDLRAGGGVLLGLPTVQYILGHHTAEHFGFLAPGAVRAKHRQAFYVALSRPAAVPRNTLIAQRKRCVCHSYEYGLDAHCR